MNSEFVGFHSKENVGAIIDRPLSAFIIRRWRAVSDRPYKIGQKFATSEDFSCN